MAREAGALRAIGCLDGELRLGRCLAVQETDSMELAGSLQTRNEAPMHRAILIDNVPGSEDRRDLERLFAPFGTVCYAVVVIDRDMLRREGVFGVVEMSSPAEAEAAMAALDGRVHGGNRLCMRWAAPKELAAAGHPLMHDIA